MAFEVLTENGTDYTIRNINGDLKATVQDGALRGKNTLDMEYKMNVKGDSAYYEFGGIVTGYKRITKEEYDRVMQVAHSSDDLEVREWRLQQISGGTVYQKLLKTLFADQRSAVCVKVYYEDNNN